MEDALADMDHVININPENVLAYYNRASYFVQMERWLDALDDYDKAIELYPDFAKAYLNRSYVKNMLGRTKSSKQDYDIAQKKVQEYRAKNATDEGSFADTTKKYSSLIALDADFAKRISTTNCFRTGTSTSGLSLCTSSVFRLSVTTRT